MNFVYMLGFTPEAIWSVYEHQILILVIDDLTHIVKVDVLEEGKNRQHVEGVSWTDNTTLDTVLHVHVLVVIAIPNIFEAPT